MSHSHPYIPLTDAEVAEMLDVVGAPDLEALFAPIPQKLRLDRPLALPRPLSEQQLCAELSRLAEQNASAATHDVFIGAGAYLHYAPSVIDTLISRGEFLTAYTPYQPELSQGTLQVIFEWQTMMSSLTGMEVSNASMYDGASATAEAILMAMRVTRRSRIVVAQGLHPHYAHVARTYLGALDVDWVDWPLAPDGGSAPIEELVDDETACVVVQQPNFLGCLENLERAAEAAHARGALLVVCVNEALSLALLRAPGDCGADIVCGEAQSFGVPLSAGGPHLGFLATRTSRVRQMPGRLAGQTVDANGKRGFVLTLSTREQHIRRERSTSNICTNQGLCLLAATIYLSLLGRRGLRRLAEINLAKAQYARGRIEETPGLALLHPDARHFNEFAVRVPDSGRDAITRALEAGILGGVDLEGLAPGTGPAVLVCTTELATREAIDRLVAALAGGGRS